MSFSHRKNTFKILFILCIFLACLQLGAMRPLGEQWVNHGGLVFHSLQKGPVRPSSPNPCTYIPGQSSGTCRLNGMNIAGNVARAPAFPQHVVDVAVASIAKETRNQDQSS